MFGDQRSKGNHIESVLTVDQLQSMFEQPTALLTDHRKERRIDRRENQDRVVRLRPDLHGRMHALHHIGLQGEAGRIVEHPEPRRQVLRRNAVDVLVVGPAGVAEKAVVEPIL